MSGIIAVDMEATLADVHRAMLRVYNGLHGTSHTVNDIQWWDWVADVIDFDEFMRVADMNWIQDPLCVPACEWSPSLERSLSTLADHYNYDVVTARSGGWYDPADGDAYDSVNDGMRAWLNAHSITSYDAFHAINTGESKAPLGYAVYIDDNPNLAPSLGADQHQIVPRRPWNEEAAEHENVTMVSSVAEGVEVATSLLS